MMFLFYMIGVVVVLALTPKTVEAAADSGDKEAQLMIHIRDTRPQIYAIVLLIGAFAWPISVVGHLLEVVGLLPKQK